jgi:hypothetical protein
MRLGKVSFKSEYIVDLDNEDMVQHAKDAIVEDLESAVRYGSSCNVEEAPEASEGDIAEFLLDFDQEEE